MQHATLARSKEVRFANLCDLFLGNHQENMGPHKSRVLCIVLTDSKTNDAGDKVRHPGILDKVKMGWCYTLFIVTVTVYYRVLYTSDCDCIL